MLDIAPYVPGKSSAPGVAKVFKLSSNETPLGPSPKAIAAYNAAGEHLEDYPDGAATRAARSHRARLRARSGRIVCGAGSDDLLNLIARAYLARRRRGDPHHARLSGLSDRDAGHRRKAGGRAGEELHRRRRRHSRGGDASARKVVFLANPNNPTGTYVPFDEVKRLHRGLPPNVLLVLDAAYAEYVRRNDYEAGIELVATSENVVMCRTFSKIHGLAALRLGWMYGPGARRRCAQPHPRAVQRQRAGDRRRHRRDRGHRACRDARARTIRNGSPG